MNDKSNGSVELILGMVIGGVIGAAAGILLAPQSGEKTRAQIKSKGEDLYSETKTKVENYKETRLDPKVEKLEKDIKRKMAEVEKKAKSINKK